MAKDMYSALQALQSGQEDLPAGVVIAELTNCPSIVVGVYGAASSSRFLTSPQKAAELASKAGCAPCVSC